MKGICLCSGGLDSTLALIKLLEQGHEVVPMFVNYHQWPSTKEEGTMHYLWRTLSNVPDREFARRLRADVRLELRLDLHGRNEIGSVWGRSVALVGIAAMWAYTHGNDYDFIALGNHKGDVGPDCKPGSFDHLLDSLLSESTKMKIRLSLPIRELTIEDIGKELGKYNIPWDHMYSCYWYPPCGYKSENEDYRCPGCRRKVIAMEAAGFTNPILLNFPNGTERTYQSESAERVDY